MFLYLWNDLESGFVGQLDELVPSLIKDDDIYGANRLTKADISKDLGVLVKDPTVDVQSLWWNSETQSNWWDGAGRSALLTGFPALLLKTQAYINRSLGNQEEDDYLGIYAPDLRYNFQEENGELWAQATHLRALLGYYEATGEDLVLRAIERAVRRTMAAYPQQHSAPFKAGPAYAGVWHGLAFTDVLDRLYQLTGDTSYQVYALWLYQDYCQHETSQADIQVQNLLNPAYRFQGHGVHTYEHLRTLITALYASGNPLLNDALGEYLSKLNVCLAPSGGPIGDEEIRGRIADPSETGYEYCSIQELLDSYSLLFQKTGDMDFGDRIEWLLFNAGQGARHPEESSFAYLKTDNSYSMTGALHPGISTHPADLQSRYKYSPVHQDVAVCCSANAGRIMPYYIRAMWMRTSTGLVATLYGPCVVKTQIGGVMVQIEETTYYPFSYEIEFVISVETPVEFELTLRKPAWANAVECSSEGADIDESTQTIKLRKTWQSGNRVLLQFITEVKSQTCNNSEQFLSHGPLLYALPLPGIKRVTRIYKQGFRDLMYDSVGGTYEYLQLPFLATKEFHLSEQAIGIQSPARALSLRGALWDVRSDTPASVDLVPIGSTVLRRATFKVLNK